MRNALYEGYLSEEGTHFMRYLDRLPAEPAVWLLAFLLVSIAGSFLYVAFSSITY